MRPEGLHVHSVTLDFTLRSKLQEVRHNDRGESEFTGNENFLETGELELRSTESLLGEGNVLRLCSDGDEDITDGDTGGLTVSLTEGTTHTLLESIGTSAGEHLVDADDVPWVNSHSDMETFLTSGRLHVLVSGNTGGFEGFRGNLFFLERDQMDAVGEKIPVGLLFTTVVHSDLGVGDTTIETRLRIRLVLLISETTSGSSSHFVCINN